MIQKALQFINDCLEDFLKNKMTTLESVVILNNVLNIDGTVAQKNQNKLILTLFNLSEEHITQTQFPINTNPINQAKNNICFFSILLSSNFDDYTESLKFLDAAYLFFNENVVFNAASFPSFPSGIDSIQVNFHNSSFDELHLVWNSIGARYLPSIIYKVRLT
jgi:hypothetical protein